MRIRIATITFLILAFLAPFSFSSSIQLEQIPFPPTTLFNFGTAIDSHRSQLVLFGGAAPGGRVTGDTWVCDLNTKRWTQLKSGSVPPGRTLHSIAYLPSIKKIVLFGGKDESGQYLNDTWIFNGKKWKKIKCLKSPAPRGIAAMSISPEGNRLVLFGGFSDTAGDLSDTWIFNGRKWTQIATRNSPPARSAVAMAPHPKSGGVLLFGGLGPGNNQKENLAEYEDTWIFDGQNWERIAVVENPGPRSSHGMILSPKSNRLYLKGGYFKGNPIDDLWEYADKKWERRDFPLSRTLIRDSIFLSNEKNGKLYCLLPPKKAESNKPQTNDLAFLNDTWAFDGSKWSRIETALAPKRRCYTSLVYDSNRQVAVLFGGSAGGYVVLDDTWEFNGEIWARINAFPAPWARYDHKMVFDSKTARTILFGGFGKEGTLENSLGDTWAFDGKKWGQLSLATNPTARSRHAMTYDKKTGRVWLFGGHEKSGAPVNDLWYFDGTDWSKEDIKAPHPAPRSSAMLACNPDESVLYLFGGYAKDQGLFQDTWKYDIRAGKWKMQPSQNPPAARQDGGLVYDDRKKAMILFGGFNGKQDLADTWELAEGKWKKLDAQGPVARAYFGMAFDSTNKQALLFGGYGLGELSNVAGNQEFTRIDKPGTWEFDGKIWKEIATGQRPVADLSYSMAYDPYRKLTILFAGYNEVSGELDQTWTYDGTNWKFIDAKDKPSKRTNASLFFDPGRKKILCYGGYNTGQGPLNDMWEFDGKNWKKLDINGPYSNFTGGNSIVYDSERGVFVYYGGRKNR